MYFLEDGGEQDNIFRNNLGLITEDTARHNLVPTDNKPSVFWIPNSRNTLDGNHAVGGTFGCVQCMAALM